LSLWLRNSSFPLSSLVFSDTLWLNKTKTFATRAMVNMKKANSIVLQANCKMMKIKNYENKSQKSK
jgi:hypothetical protein